MQKDLVDFLLTELRPKPGMFLTAYSLSYLEIFLTGVQITCWKLDKTEEYSKRFFDENGFVKWSWLKYKIEYSSYRLDHYLKIAKGNEKAALDVFFEDLEQYHTEHSASIR